MKAVRFKTLVPKKLMKGTAAHMKVDMKVALRMMARRMMARRAWSTTTRKTPNLKMTRKRRKLRTRKLLDMEDMEDMETITGIVAPTTDTIIVIITAESIIMADAKSTAARAQFKRPTY